mgnify:CR=1 FL=1
MSGQDGKNRPLITYSPTIFRKNVLNTFVVSQSLKISVSSVFFVGSQQNQRERFSHPVSGKIPLKSFHGTTFSY